MLAGAGLLKGPNDTHLGFPDLGVKELDLNLDNSFNKKSTGLKLPSGLISLLAFSAHLSNCLKPDPLLFSLLEKYKSKARFV